MEKLLITGASGLIGSECCRLMKEEYDIYGTYLNNKLDLNIHFVQMDILDIKNVVKKIRELRPDRILHLAWETEHGKYLNDIKNLEWPKATYNLIKCFYENGGKSAVVAGTCFEYDLNFGVLKEDITPLNPSSIYGISKKYTYELLSLFGDTNNFPIAWGRIFYVYGGAENSTRLVPYIINKLLDDEIAVCGSGESIRDFMHVTDIAQAFLCLLKSEYSGAVNICTGNTTKIKEIALEAERILNKNGMVLFNSDNNRKNEPSVILGDNKKLCSTGFVQQSTLAGGIQKTIDYWKNIHN